MNPASVRRVALVTGANRGLGAATSLLLAQEGIHVLIGSRDVKSASPIVDEIRIGGGKADAVTVDVADRSSVQEAADLIGDRFGRLDILVNNAGVFIPAPTFEVSDDDLSTTFGTNLLGTIRVTNTLVPLLAKALAPRVVNVTSTTASCTRAGSGISVFGDIDNFLAYVTSKAALNRATLHYHQRFANDPALTKIKINAVTPGYIATDLNDHQGHRSVEQGARVVLRYATLDNDGPSGGFFEEDGVVPW